MITCSPLFAQISIKNPSVNSTDDWNTTIKQIEVNDKYTIISFETTASSANSWVQLNKEIYLQTDERNTHFNYVKSEKIPLVPVKEFLINAGDKYDFKVYFEKIPATAKSINIIERAGPSTGAAYLNFYGVSLSNSGPAVNNYVSKTITDTVFPKSNAQRIKTVSVTLTPPPPGSYQTGNTFSVGDASSSALLKADNVFAQTMQSVVPMMGSMAKTMMDAQIEYYKQPGKIAEIAKLNKEYYDALRKEGFSSDDAIKVITASGIMPKVSGLDK